MISREYIVNAFSFLGETVRDFLDGKHCSVIETAISCSCIENYWFTQDNILRALDAIVSKMLDRKKLNEWISHYSFDRSGQRRTGLIMAGNIPMAGFHDLLSVLLAGNIAVIKPSSKDKFLIKALCEIMSDKFPALAARIVFADCKPLNIDAVIATGSNNSSRYFRAEYRNIPLMARKNRYSVAILDGSETLHELEDLGDDIFSYFGLGCRNVSNIFVPQNYEWHLFLRVMEKYSHVMEHQGYNDCFRYRKALSELSGENYLDNGFVIIRENALAFASIAAINYTVYEDIEQAKTFLAEQKDKIQCIVTKTTFIENPVSFGQTQCPELADYADGVDTVEFLSKCY
jgi:hypothetical protein